MTQPPQPPPPPQPPYGPPPPYGYPMVPPDHPQATTVLVLGIVSVVVCGVVAPFAWVMGNRVVAEIDASGGQYGGRSNANAGRVIGMVVTVIYGLLLLLGVLLIAVAAIGVLSTSP